MKASAATRRERDVRTRSAKPAPPPFRRKLLFEALEPRILLSAAPGSEALLLIPGFGATQAAEPALVDEWLTTRGIAPDKLQIDPLSNSAGDLIASLENIGYSRDPGDWTGADAETPLIIANWDWRVRVAERDTGAADGTLTGVTAESITGTGPSTEWVADGFKFETGLDYLGYYLAQAAEAGFESVDIITHSTGGLVARAYMQSAAYGAQYDSDGDGLIGGLDKFLPTVDDLVLVGVPSEGVSQSWNMLLDDYNVKSASRGMAHILDLAWNKMEEGIAISGPDGDITLADLHDDVNTPQNEAYIEFAQRYIGAGHDLVGTYAMVDYNDGVDGNFAVVAPGDPDGLANTLVADLNFGAGPENMVNRGGEDADGKTVIVYSDTHDTLGRLIEREGFTAEAGRQNELLSLGQVIGHLPGSSQVWYEETDIDGVAGRGGDGTVPTLSAKGPFDNVVSDRVVINEITEALAGEKVDHVGLLVNKYSQKQILDAVTSGGVTDAQISQGEYYSSMAQQLSVIVGMGLLDPREFVLDALDDIGRLLDGVTGSTALNTDLPFVGKSVMDVLPFMASFSSAVATARSAVFEYGTLEELNEFLADELGDDFTLSFAFDDGQFTVNLGYNPSASTTVSLDVAGNSISADLEVEFNLDVAVGVDLTDPQGGKDMVFVRIDDLSASARIADDDLDLEVHIGDLTAAIVDGSASLEVSVGLALVDPNDDHKLTITELLDGFQHPTDFIDPSLSGTLDVVLPFDATVAGFDLGAFGTPTLEAHDADIFDAEAPEVTVNVFLDDPEVQANILALLDNGLEGIDFLNDPLPVIGQSLNDLIGFAINDILDLHDIVADYFASYETGGENEGGRADVVGLVDWVSAALAERLESLFMAGGEGPLEISGGYDLETQTVFFNLDLEAFLAQHLELAFDADNLNLEELLGFDPTRLLDLRANAEIDLEASADLHFGFDLDLSDLFGEGPQFSLDADSGFTAHLGGTADDLDFTLGLDVFGATLGLVVADGSAEIDLDFSAGFAKEGGDANDDGRVQFDELVDSFQAVASGAATLDLPLYFPIKAMPVGGTTKDKDGDTFADNVLHAEASLSAVADSGGFSLGTDYEFITPDFTVDFDVAAALIGLLNDPQTLLDGLEGFFSGIDTVADGIDFIELPLIGGAPFDDLAGSLRGLRTDVLGHSAAGNYSDGLGKWLQDKAADPDDPGVFEAVLDMVRTEIYNGLSPLNSELFSFVVPVLDDDGNPTFDDNGKMITRLPTSADDIELRLTDDGELLFNIKFGGVLVGHRTDDGVEAEAIPIDFNVGLPGLSLEVDADLLTTIDYLMGIGLGITGDPDHFVFLDTTGVTEDGEELAFDVDATLGAGSSASGTLGFLAMHFDVVEDSGLHGHFGLDIADSSGDEQGSEPDGRLTIGETPVFSLNASASADAMVHAVVDTVAGGVLPSVETTIEYHQLLGEINFTLGEGLHFDSGSPDVTLHDVTLNVGSVFSSFLGDALSTINDIVQPFKPVVDLLLTEVDLGITKFKMIDIARLKLPGKTVDTAEKVLEVIQSTIEFLDSLEDMTSANGINFGDFHLTESTIEDPDAPSSPEDVAGATPDDSNLTPTQKAALKGPDQKGLDTRTSTTTPAGKRPLPTQKRFSIPILEDPASLLDFILDRGAVDLFYYDLPDLNLLFEYQKTYPVFPGLNAGFFGSIGASTNFDFGYDTRGLREWWNADFAPDKFWMIFDGFYLDDHGLENTTSDMPEVVLKAAVGAVASLGIGGLIEAGVKGGIEAKIEFDLNDRLTEFQGDTPVGDGKFYGSELISRLSHGPECLFDMHGQLSVFLEAFFWIGLDLGFSEITIFEASERFVDEIIASFDHECLLDAPRDLADLDNGVLTLRYAGDDSGGPHDYIVTHESGESLTLPYLVSQGYIDLDFYTEAELNDLRDNILPALRASDEQIIVVTTGARAEFFRSSQVDTIRSFGTSQSDTYKIQGLNGLVSSIDIRGGDSGDIIEITASATGGILQSLNVEGGGGDDYIRVDPALLGVQPAGVADKWVLRGGDGDDRIKLGTDDGDDPSKDSAHVYSYSGVLLDGGAGNDTIFGHTGAEHIEGGDGDDLILAYGGNDLVHGGEGNDYIAGGTGADQLFGDGDDDRIFGSTGNDDIHGGEGSDTLMGEAGDDTIAGDGGDDLMVGAAGNDLLFGGDGDDRATWQLGEGLDTYSGGAGADELQMDGFITDAQAFYTDPDNYIQDDGLVDVVNVHVATPLDANGAHDAQVDWTHGAGAMITMVTGEVETLRLDAGRGADNFHIGDVQSTSLDSVRVSGGQTRGIVEEEHVARDGQGRAAGQDLTLSGDAGDQFRLRVGNYGAASALITLVDDGTGDIDFQSTAIAIQDALRSLVGVVTLDVTYDADSQKYKVTGLGDVADALLVKDAAVQATAKTLQELTLSVAAGQMFGLRLGPTGTPTAPIEALSNGLGGVDTGGTAANIEAALRALTGNSTVEVVYGSNTYRVSGLGDSAPALELASPPPGASLVTGFSQELVLDGLPGQQFALTSGSMATEAITIGATGAANAASIQSALRELTGFGSLVVTFQPAGVSAAGEAIAASYKISGFAAGTAALQLAASNGTPVTATSGTTQKLALTGTAGQQFRLQLGSSGLPSDVLALATDANGDLDTEATAAAIQEAVRALTHSPVPTVAFDSASSCYVIKGLDASAAALQVDTTGLASNVAGSSATTRVVALVGAVDQQFRLKFGPGGSLTGLVTIGATNALTAASMQDQLRALLGGTSITVAFDADAQAFNIDGLLAPADALVLDPGSPSGGATFTSAPGVDIFKVFRVGPDEAVDTIVIEGSEGADDYRVSSLQAVGVDGKSETSLRYEQLNGQLATTGQPLSYVVVDVFGLERTDYVRLVTLGGADHIDATAVADPVVSHLYLDGGEGGDRIIGSNLATTADVILGGAGDDRLTGGAGVDQFFENTVGDDGNTAGDFDTLIETRDADFYLSDTSLRIDDRILHNQFGNEVEQFGDIFEAVELYGLDGANRFELSGWSDSGLLDGYKGGDTYVLELASAVVAHQSIFINDTGASGIDSLTFKGSAGADFIQLDTVYDPSQDPDHRFDDARWLGYGNHGDGLIIAHFNPDAQGYGKKDLDDEDALFDVNPSSLSAGANFQVINYHTVEQVVVFGGAGNDTFISDSTAAQIDLYGNEGDDQFYVGSVLETEEVIVEGQIITIVKQITDGAVFNNSSYYGGDGDDYFEVNHNAADINLFGDNGDDTFLVKALLTINEDDELVDLDSKVANVSGTFGQNSDQGTDITTDTREVDVDTLVYVENANVNIDGGAGFDAVSLVGTVLSDTFYIYTEVDPATGKPVQRIYGAGVKLQKLLNIERLQVLAGGGDDTIYLYGSDMGPIGDMVIKAGSGSDTIMVGGPAQTISLSFPKNSDQFYSTVEGYQVDKDALGKFIRVGEVDGLPFYQVRSLTRIAPFAVENPAHTTQIVMPASYSLEAFKAPVIIDGGAGLHDVVQMNLTLGTQQAELSDRLLLKKDVEFDDAKLHLAATSADPLVQALLAAGGAAGAEARDLLNGAVESYIRFADRYDQPGLVDSLQALSGAQTLLVDVPAGIGYFNIQNTLVDNEVLTAREQLIDFASTFGLTLTWKDVAHPDPTRAAAGEMLHELLSVKKGSVSLAFEALHSETVVFSGSTKTIVKDLTGLTLKTTATLKATFDAGAITKNVLVRSDAVDTLAPEGAKSRLHFSGFDTMSVQLSQLPGGSKLTIDNDNFTGRLEINGGAVSDLIFIKTVAAETVVHGGDGDDTITVGRNGLLDGIGAPLHLFGDAGNDQITIDDTADTSGRGVTLEQELLQHSTNFEQLSRITDALSLKGITAAENAIIADKLEDAAVPYGEAALNVDAADLTAYRDYAAAGLLENLKATVSGLGSELSTAVASAVALLKDRDQALLENQIKLYVRARYYEGSNGKFLTDELLRLMNVNDGMKTWLRYEDWDSYWSPFSTHWYIDWGTSNNVARVWDIKGGLNEIRKFFQDPNGTFASYGEAGVSNSWLAGTYLPTIENLLKGSLYGLMVSAYYSPDKLRLLGGGQLDDDENMWLYLRATDVNTATKRDNLFALSRIYDEAVNNYIGSASIYSTLLQQRGLSTSDLNTLYNQYKDDSKIRGFSWSETNYGKSQMIGSVGDFTIEVAQQYRMLTPDVSNRVNALQSSFTTVYQGKINELQSAIQTAITNHDYSAATLNSIKTKTDQLTAFFNPAVTQSADAGITAEATFAKAPVYNRLVTGTGNGVTTLLGEVADLSQKIQNGNFAAVAAKAGSTDFTVLRNEFNSAEYHNVRLAYQAAAQLIDDFTLFNARYLGDAPRPAALDSSTLDIKRQDRAADTFSAFDQALQGTFNFDAFRTAFLTTQESIADFLDLNPDYSPNILLESRAGAQADSLAQDAKDIAQPVAVNRIQYNLFNAALTKARSDLATLQSQLYQQYTVTRSYWWFSQTYHLDYTNDARYIQQRDLVNALQQKVTKSDGFADASDAQSAKLNSQEAGYQAQENAAGAKVDAKRAQYEALTDQINGQFTVLKELSRFAIDVLKQSRPGQSAAGFVDTNSLISELSAFSDEYSVLPAGSPAVPTDSSEFLPGSSANSVVQSEQHTRFSSILSVKGLGAQIHIGRDDVEGLAVLLGGADDEVTVLQSLAAGNTTIDLGAGTDYTRVKAIDGATTVNAGDGADTVDVYNDDARLYGIDATLTVNGGAASDTINLVNTFDFVGTPGTLTATTLTGLGMGGGIVYGGTETLNLSLGVGDDDLTVQSTAAGVQTNVFGDLGDDVVTVLATGGLGGTTNLFLAEGADTVNITGSGNGGLQAIQGDLIVAADLNGASDGQSNTLNITDTTALDKSGLLSGALTASTLTGLAMGGVVQYGGFETLNLTLGRGADNLVVQSTMGGATNISGGAGSNDLDDTIKIETLAGEVTVSGGYGNDAITLFDGAGDFAAPGTHLTIDGARGDDTITLNLGRRTALAIDVTDSDPLFGFDNLVVNGTGAGDAVYLGAGDKSIDLTAGVLVIGQKVDALGRPLFYRQATSNGQPDGDPLYDADGLPQFALDAGGQPIETAEISEFPVLLDNPSRDTVSYMRIDKLTVQTFGGDDVVQMDDNAVETVINLGAGDDRITIATVATTPDQFGIPVVNFEQTTRGSSAKASIYGGDDNDEFNVNHNEAELFLYGENGDDVFAVFTFLVLKDEADNDVNLTTLDGGAGHNSYEYLQNAPVHVNGGAGNDTLIITGTPIADVFIVTDKYVAGAGRQVLIEDNVEKVIVQGAGGDDEIYVLSTKGGSGFETIVRGGSGNDHVHVGGEPPVMVFDPPPTSIKPAPIQQVRYVIEQTPVVIDPPAFFRTVPLGDLNNLQAYAAQYRDPGGNAQVSLQSINSAPISFGFWFFSWTISLPVSATIRIDPVAYTTYTTRVVQQVTTITPPAFVVDPPPFAFKAAGTQDLTGIRGKLTIDGGVGQDSVVVHDGGGAAGAGIMTSDTLTGLGMGASGVNYTGVENMDVRLGASADTFTVEQSIAGTTRIDAGGGNDTINIEAISGDTAIWGAAGDDTINVHDDASTLAGIGATLTVDGDAHLDEQTVNWVNGMPATDVPATPLVVNSLGQQFTTVDANGVKTFHPGPDGLAYVNVAKLNTDGSVMKDALENVITERVLLPFPNKQATLQSLAGHDTLNIDNTGENGDVAATLDASSFDASNMPGRIVYSHSPSTVEDLNITLGGGDDTADILGTNVATATYLHTGDGNDLIRVGDNGSLDGIAGALTLDAGAGIDNRLIIDGSADVDADGNVRVSAGSVTGLAPATINYAASGGFFRSAWNSVSGAFSEGISILLGRGNDTATVTSTRDNAGVVEVTAVHANDGDDHIFVEDTDAHYLTVHGDRGNDRIEVVPPGAQNGLTAFGGDGNDTITGGTGPDVLVGGLGIDTINGGAGNDTVVGDNAAIVRDAFYKVQRISGLADEADGDDVLSTSEGNDVVIGGGGNDDIDAISDGSIIVGDAGTVVFADGSLEEWSVFTLVGVRGNDSIDSGANAIVLGGGGDDSINLGGGTNTVVGDEGVVSRDGPGFDQVNRVVAASGLGGGADTITSSGGHNIILGGQGSDIIDAAAGSNVVLGDDGQAFFGYHGLWYIETDDALGGGDDRITGGADNTILGGVGRDTISAGGGVNTILGDGGKVERAEGGEVLRVLTVDFFLLGGDDGITLGDGINTVLGGLGSDSIDARGGTNVILGDDGEVVIGGDVTSARIGLGATDFITAGSNNTILGGAGADEITAQGGVNTILGDNGTVKRGGGVVTQVLTADDDFAGGNDHIVLGDGTNTVLGGMGADIIDAPGGINIILGDNGEVNVGGTVLSRQPGLGGDDIITAGSNNTILGGAGADHISAGGGVNTILGDNGTVERAAGDIVTHVFTADVDGSTGGDDVITLGNGTNTVLGGMGADTISAPGGINIVLGDNGDVVIGGDVVSTQLGQGGDDIITAGSNNTILGGAGADQITAQGGTNTILGDNGTVKRSGGVVTQVFTADLDGTTGGNDRIVLGDGTNTVLGGMGADTIEAPGGINIILGDNGDVVIGGDVVSTQLGQGGDDIITAGSNNTILGGAGADRITAQGGINTILGDNGTVKRVGAAVLQVFTADIDGLTGGNDRILLGQDSINTVLGGMGADVIDAPGGVNIILGDNGEVNVGGDVRSMQTSQGGADIITAGSNNTILGGFGGDSITLGAGSNTVLGDNGTVQRSGGVVTRVVTGDADASTGGVDTIRSQGGTNIILGGVAGDLIDAALGVNIVLGDNGEVNAGGDVFTTQPTVGGADIITGGADNIILGGAGGDSITLGAGSNTVLGDNGTVKRSGGVVTQVFTADEDGTTGGADTIVSNGGSNIILGGSFADTISAPGGTNIILGDNGVVIVGGDVYTTQPTVGGADRITGGSGNNIILGGAGNDLISGGAGRDIALGDNGIVKRTAGNVTRVETTDTCIGGDDVITGGAGDNILIGGAGNDIIDGGSGNEIMVGGAGTVDLTGPLPLVTSGDDICDGADIIHGGDGNDVVWGGGGNDQLYGGLGNDKIYGQGGNDIILGDVGQIIAGRDVLLTDVAHVSGEMALNGSGMPASNAATVSALLNADVVLLAGVNNADGSRKLNSDGTWASRALLLDLAADGDDTISGGDGDDQIFGQRGNDVLTGDAGNDALSGGAGNDRVDGGAGNDTVVGDDVTIDSPTAAFGNVMHGYLVDGVAVVPALQVAPGDTPNAAAAALATLFGNPAMPASSSLPASGGTLTVYASVLTDFGHHLGQLNGNDTVIGGLGDDTLVGDDQSVVARSVTFDAATMARTEALTRAMLDITDDFSDMVHAQYSQIGCDWWDDHYDWWDHDDDVVVDNVFTVGADSLDGGDGNDVLIGDDSILAETTFTLQVGYADDVERFAEGMADAGNEAGDALIDLVYLDTRLRDQDVLVKHYTHWDHETVHHIDLVAMGNDTLNGGAGNDLMVGDAFTMRTAQANLVVGGTVPTPSDDDIWKNSDWCDDNHHHWWFDGHDHHDWNEDWHFGSVTSSADVINAGAGNDLVWGDSLAVQSTTITRGAGISNSNYDHAKNDAEDALCSLVSLTDSADYWLALQDGGHCDNDYGDTINGGDGDDILFGQAGNDKLRGEAGADWLIGGDGYNDCLDGGSGSDHTSNGNDNSSSLRSAVNSRLVNWKDSFKNYGVPFSPFGGLKTTKYGGCSDRDSFDFLTLDA